jgi:hypothetical protein
MSTTTIPCNDLNDAPKSGPFQLIAIAVAKSDEQADELFKMVKAVQKRALSSEEPKTTGVSQVVKIEWAQGLCG